MCKIQERFMTKFSILSHLPNIPPALRRTLTEVYVQQGCVGSFYQDLLGRTVKGLVHVVHAIPHHGLDLLRVVLRWNAER